MVQKRCNFICESKSRIQYSYKLVCSHLATTLTTLKTIHIYYLNKSHDLLNSHVTKGKYGWYYELPCGEL